MKRVNHSEAVELISRLLAKREFCSFERLRRLTYYDPSTRAWCYQGVKGFYSVQEKHVTLN